MATQTLLSAFVWVKAHPFETLQWLLFAWGIANVLWAQWPKPKSERAQKVWAFLHHLFQLIATTSEAKGTFTWPSIVRAVLGGLVKAPDPFRADAGSPVIITLPVNVPTTSDQIADEVIARMERKASTPEEIQ